MLNDSPCNESASRPITSSFLRRISSPAPPCPQPSKSMNFLASPQPRHTNNNRSTLKKPSDRSSAPVLNRLSSIFSSSLRRPSCRRMNNSAATPTKSVSTRPTEEFKPCILATFPSPAARSRQHLASRPRPHSQFDISSTTDTLRKRRHTDVHVTLMRQISESSESSSVSSTKTLHNSSTSGNCSSGSSSDESEKETDEETSVATEEDLGDDDFVKGAELGAGLAGPTPAKSCSTIYPSLETRIHDLPHTQRPQSPANESRLIRAGHDRPFSPREKNLFRHRTVFGKTDHAKKENKTVSIWRASVEKLLQQSPHNAPALLGGVHASLFLFFLRFFFCIIFVLSFPNAVI
ncbi:uncharacterized protein BYT42DRAFT_3458 [Radiomyces spectabilis]|uniref:uncharacterized protein n=1 Tax=Radiomyces spectabilis TaxID=64574 RepID=UPI00221F28FF|nr:uncharacterized protein BYT42DRAFT_3458 [Radiomyces spectabilis]KAI8393353.1 hypothetical protein BYT42DRAFT_3458 [Radiomyces spectabilis]